MVVAATTTAVAAEGRRRKKKSQVVTISVRRFNLCVLFVCAASKLTDQLSDYSQQLYVQPFKQALFMADERVFFS